MNSPSKLSKIDPEIAAIIAAEQKRQFETLELIASENHVSPAVLEAMGSVLTDKYAEGYPGRRYYCGNENVDAVERLCIERAKKLFGAEHVNVQPHCGTSANLAVYIAALKPGDKIMGMRLGHGGHLSHGAPVSISGITFKSVRYGVRKETEMLDMDDIRKQALKERPALIVSGASAYPRIIDFEAFASIGQEVGCPVLADIAHIAGLVAGGVHPSPVGCCDFVTTTNHKTLRGPRGGIILCKAKWAKVIDSAVFPGIQGGPLEHVVAAKAVAFHEAMKPQFKHYVETILANARALAEELLADGWRLVSGGTDNHLLLIDLRSHGDDYTGHAAADWLASAGLIANWNAIPFDPRPPMQASGIRLGTPAVTTRGMGPNEMREIADMIDRILVAKGDKKVIAKVSGRVSEMCSQFPIPTNNYQ